MTNNKNLGKRVKNQNHSCTIHRNTTNSFIPLGSNIQFSTNTEKEQVIIKQTCNNTAGNRHKQNSRFYTEIREDNFRFWWRRVHEDASQGMYMSTIEISFSTTWILKKISFNFIIFISFQTGFHTYSALKILLKCHFHLSIIWVSTAFHCKCK